MSYRPLQEWKEQLLNSRKEYRTIHDNFVPVIETIQSMYEEMERMQRRLQYLEKLEWDRNHPKPKGK